MHSYSPTVKHPNYLLQTPYSKSTPDFRMISLCSQLMYEGRGFSHDFNLWFLIHSQQVNDCCSTRTLLLATKRLISLEDSLHQITSQHWEFIWDVKGRQDGRAVADLRQALFSSRKLPVNYYTVCKRMGDLPLGCWGVDREKGAISFPQGHPLWAPGANASLQDSAAEPAPYKFLQAYNKQWLQFRW